MLLALDQGTTSSRAIVFDLDGRIRGVAQREFTQHFPYSGWVEHDANEIWVTQAGVITEALERARVRAGQVQAVGITNQRETIVLWDRATGEPVAPAIVWQDRRTAKFCEQLRRDGHAPLLAERTGLVIDPYLSASKLSWLLDHVPDARQRADAGELAFGTIDSWLIWKLTDGQRHVTDFTNASRTQLCRLDTGQWDDDLLQLFGIPRALLPDIVPSSGVVGETTTSALPVSVPIAGIAGDQQAALFGQACFQPGMVKNTYGTGCFILIATGTERVVSQHQLLTTAGWQLQGADRTYAVEGSAFVAGAVVQWLRDGLRLIRRAEDVEELAARVPDAGGATLVPAFTGLGAPYWDAEARGGFVGITRNTSDAHLARAALESIAHQVADVVGAMQADGSTPVTELRVDGGASVNNLLMQFQADLLGVPVVRAAIPETTALGAAWLAGLGVGALHSQDALAAQWQSERTFEPQMPETERSSRRDAWTAAVARVRS